MQSPPPPPPPSGGMVPPQPPLGYAAPVASGGQTTYGGFWIRVVARLLDGLVVGIPFAILFGIIAVAFGASANSSNQGTQQAGTAIFGGAFVLLYLIAIVVSVVYWIYFWGSSGQTIGMRVLRLRVVDADNGAPIGYGRAAIRFLMSIINSLACYIGWIWVAFDARKQGWHDKVANSVVIHY
jgi:uncharacterized RDD family membrane protein YckC